MHKRKIPPIRYVIPACTQLARISKQPEQSIVYQAQSMQTTRIAFYTAEDLEDNVSTRVRVRAALNGLPWNAPDTYWIFKLPKTAQPWEWILVQMDLVRDIRTMGDMELHAMQEAYHDSIARSRKERAKRRIVV